MVDMPESQYATVVSRCEAIERAPARAFAGVRRITRWRATVLTAERPALASNVDTTRPQAAPVGVCSCVARFRGRAANETIPYFQAKVIAKDDTEFAFAFGLRF